MPAGIEVLSLRDIGFEQEIEETGLTLAENSKIKASTVAAFINDGMSASLKRRAGCVYSPLVFAFASLGHVPKLRFSRESSGAPLSPKIRIFGGPFNRAGDFCC